MGEKTQVYVFENDIMMDNLVEIEASIRRLNRLFFLAIIPGLCVLIPMLAGILSINTMEWWQLVLSYLYFVGISTLIWTGNIYLYAQRKKYQGKCGYFEVLTYYLLACMLNSGLVAVAGLYAWQHFTGQYQGIEKSLFSAASLVMFSVLLINSISELISGRREMAENNMKYRRMEIAKVQAELEALKAEIDPHFIFNSLNTLSYLIINKPESAKCFNETLAKVYRYILLNKDNDLVMLRDELEFIESYFYLVKIRFEEAVNLVIDITEAEADEFLITPVSLQMLIENAIKHNDFSTRCPLVIRINIHSLFVTVRNHIRRKDYDSRPSGIGLKNLKDRYRLIMKKNIIIHRENEEFLVQVPILKA